MQRAGVARILAQLFHVPRARAPVHASETGEGIYRVRVDYGVSVKNRYYGLNGDSFSRRPFFKGRPTESHIYSPPIQTMGTYTFATMSQARAPEQYGTQGAACCPSRG